VDWIIGRKWINGRTTINKNYANGYTILVPRWAALNFLRLSITASVDRVRLSWEVRCREARCNDLVSTILFLFFCTLSWRRSSAILVTSTNGPHQTDPILHFDKNTTVAHGLIGPTSTAYVCFISIICSVRPHVTECEIWVWRIVSSRSNVGPEIQTRVSTTVSLLTSVVTMQQPTHTQSPSTR
jgi:hypothetical protein